MSLPAYAEELKRAAAHGYDGTPFGRSAGIVNCIDKNLDRILRDAEIAQAVRLHVLAKLPPAVRDILTKETP